MQAEAFARSKGLQLVGYYQANEQIADLELGGIGKKVTERIQSHAPDACALLVCQSYVNTRSKTLYSMIPGTFR